MDYQESPPTPQFKSINSSPLSFLYGPTLISIHDYWKKTALIRWTFVDKVMSLLLNMLSRLVIAFLPRSKHLLISWLQSTSAVILEPQKIKSDTVSTVSPSIPMKWWDRMPWSSFSECWALSQLFHSNSSYLINVALYYMMAQTVKSLPAMKETWIQSLDQEDPVQKGMATHSSILVWRILWTEEPGGLQSIVSELDTEQLTLINVWSYLLVVVVMLWSVFSEILT